MCTNQLMMSFTSACGLACVPQHMGAGAMAASHFRVAAWPWPLELVAILKIAHFRWENQLFLWEMFDSQPGLVEGNHC